MRPTRQCHESVIAAPQRTNIQRTVTPTARALLRLLFALSLACTSAGCNDGSVLDTPKSCTPTWTSPNGGEVWKAGTEHATTWTPVECGDSVKVELLRNGEVCQTIVKATPDDGTEPWIASQCEGETTGYRVRITHLGTGEWDESDEDFSVPFEVHDVGRVLFLGNSLTYVNNLPLMVRWLATSSGITIESEAITNGGFGLIDHWNVPGRRAAVQSGNYDVVIMQQGPSSLPESRDSLRAWTKLWEPTIRAGGGRPALYAVWPDKSRFFAFPDVSESYRLAAEDVDGLFFPVGDAWLETWKADPNARLYGPDDFHPSIAGTYVAAVTILAVLAKRDATSLSPDYRMPMGIGGSIDSTLAATIREAVQRVLE